MARVNLFWFMMVQFIEQTLKREHVTRLICNERPQKGSSEEWEWNVG